jgi:hypothetical protein
MTETTPCVHERRNGEMPGLLAQLVQANYNRYAATTQTLIGSLEGQNAELQARLDAIRERITAALEGPYMPTPAHIESLLWPSAEVVDQYRDGQS